MSQLHSLHIRWNRIPTSPTLCTRKAQDISLPLCSCLLLLLRLLHSPSHHIQVWDCHIFFFVLFSQGTSARPLVCILTSHPNLPSLHRLDKELHQNYCRAFSPQGLLLNKACRHRSVGYSSASCVVLQGRLLPENTCAQHLDWLRSCKFPSDSMT